MSIYTHSAVAPYKPPILVTGVRFPVCAQRHDHDHTSRLSDKSSAPKTEPQVYKPRIGQAGAAVEARATSPRQRNQNERVCCIVGFQVLNIGNIIIIIIS